MLSISTTFAQKLPKEIAQLNEKEKVNKLLELSKNLRYKDTKKSMEYAEFALKISQEQNYEERKAEAYLRLTFSSWMLLEYAKANQYALKALEIYTKLQDNLGVFSCYTELGYIHRDLANYPKALDFYFKALKIIESEKDEVETVNTLLNISDIYFYLDDYKKAIEYSEKSLVKALEINDSLMIGSAYQVLAVNYLELKNYEKALSHYLKAIDYLKILEIKNETHIISQTALVYDYLGNFEKGKEYHQLAFNLLKEETTSMALLEYHLDLGESFYIQKKYDKALQHYEVGLQTSEKQGNEAFMYDFYERIAITYRQIGDYKNAFQFQAKFMQLKDSIYNKQNSNSIAEMQTIYETEEKEKQIFMEQQKNKLQKAELAKERYQKLFLIIGISLALIFTVYLFYSNYQRLKKNQLLSTQKEEIESQNDQLLKLGSFKEQMTSMIAHDLKNPLNTIIGLSQEENVNPYISQSGQQILTMVNNMLDVHKFEETEIQLQLEEIELKTLIKRAFTEVSFLSKQKNLQIIDEIEKDYRVKVDTELMKRVFINLLTNAIKYSPSNANIYFNLEELSTNEIKLFIKDEGIGIEKEYQKKIFDKFSQVEARSAGLVNSTGLGLTFCKMVIEAHQGQIGVISQKEKGTVFWFNLNFEAINENKQLQGNIFQEETQVAIEKLIKGLSKSEKEFLKSYIPALKKVALLEVGKISDILEEVRENNSEKIKKWADEVENTVYTNNAEAYKDLISLNE